MPFSAPRLTLLMSGSSTYSRWMRATTSLTTPIWLRVSSWVDAPWPSTLPIRNKRVRHVEVLTTRYFQRLLIGGENSGALNSLYSDSRGRPGNAPEPLLIHWTRRGPVRFWLRRAISSPSAPVARSCAPRGDGRARRTWPGLRPEGPGRVRGGEKRGKRRRRGGSRPAPPSVHGGCRSRTRRFPQVRCARRRVPPTPPDCRA